MGYQKKSDRTESYNVLNSFLNNHSSLNIVAWWKDYGTAIFWNTPIKTETNLHGSENTLDFVLDLINAGKKEVVSGIFPVEEISDLKFTTYYTRIWKNSRDEYGPLSFDTGGGYRHMIKFLIYGYSKSKDQIEEVTRTAEEFLKI